MRTTFSLFPHTGQCGSFSNSARLLSSIRFFMVSYCCSCSCPAFCNSANRFALYSAYSFGDWRKCLQSDKCSLIQANKGRKPKVAVTANPIRARTKASFLSIMYVRITINQRIHGTAIQRYFFVPSVRNTGLSGKSLCLSIFIPSKVMISDIISY